MHSLTKCFFIALLVGILLSSLSGCEYNQVRLDSTTRDLLKNQEKVSVGFVSDFRFWEFDNPRCQVIVHKLSVATCRDRRSDPHSYKTVPDDFKINDPNLEVRDHVIWLLQTNLVLQNLRSHPMALNASVLYDTNFVLVVKNDSLTFTNGSLGSPSDPEGVFLLAMRL